MKDNRIERTMAQALKCTLKVDAADGEDAPQSLKGYGWINESTKDVLFVDSQDLDKIKSDVSAMSHIYWDSRRKFMLRAKTVMPLSIVSKHCRLSHQSPLKRMTN